MRIVLLGNHSVDFSSESHHAKSLESLGHEVIRLQETQAGTEQILEESLKSDMFIYIHTHRWLTPGNMSMATVLKKLKEAGIPSVSYHLDLFLGLHREKDLYTEDVYKHIEHFFTVDQLMADWFNENTKVKGHFLPAGVLEDECKMFRPTDTDTVIVGEKSFEVVPKYKHDVIFVGSRNYHPEWPYRPQLIDWLKSTYGSRFAHYGGDGLGVIRGHALNQLYADSKIVIGDTLCIGFDYPEYISDRLFETTGRGGFIIHPYIKGIENHFKLAQELVVYEYNNFYQLEGLIDFYTKHDKPREAIRRRGHERTKKDHTYTKRWQTILETVNG